MFEEAVSGIRFSSTRKQNYNKTYFSVGTCIYAYNWWWFGGGLEQFTLKRLRGRWPVSRVLLHHGGQEIRHAGSVGGGHARELRTDTEFI